MAEETKDPFIDPLNPLSHITDHRPLAEAAKDVEAWYETEEMELNFGEENGRPSKDVQARREMLDSLFRDGWYVTEVKGKAEGGEWKRVVTQTQSQSSQGSSSGQSQSESNSESTNSTESESTSDSTNTNRSSSDASSESTSTSTAGYNAWMGRESTTSTSGGSSTSESDAEATTSSTGTQTGSATETATGTGSESYSDQEYSSSESTSMTEEEGAPYYYAYAVVRLQRRRMQSNRVLKTMVDTLVARFNEGKTINLDRYDEIVALYALMLSRTETEGNKLIDDGIDFIPLFDDIKAMIEAALDNVTEARDADWKAGRIAEINRRFDALAGQIRAKLVSEGRYNTTVYTAEVAGNERERQYALNKVKDDIINVELRIAEMKANVGNNLISAQTRIFEALQKKRIDPINLRNTVFKWMLDFMERRQDEYPELSEMQTVAERLGYAGGIAYPGGE